MAGNGRATGRARARARVAGGSCPRRVTGVAPRALVSLSSLTLAAVGSVVLAVPASAATFTVTNTDDSGPGSLRQAVIDANQASGPDTITFAPGLGAPAIITLTSGALEITDPVTITGPGSGKLTIDGNDTSRVFAVQAGTEGVTTIAGLRVNGGNAGFSDGGGIRSTDSDLVLQDVRVEESTAVYGGGIHASGGKLTVEDSYVAYNTSSADGGGIWSNAVTTVDHTQVSDNVAANGSGGGLRLLDGGSLTWTTVTRNEVRSEGRSGGGLYVTSTDGDSTFTMSAGQISSNRAPEGRGGGAAIDAWNLESRLVATLTDMTIEGNQAPAGSGLDLVGHVAATASRSTFTENGQEGAEAVAGAALRATSDAILGMQNSTVSGNDAADGSVVLLQADPSTSDPSLLGVFDHVTLAGNTGDSGLTWGDTAGVIIQNSILHGTTDAGGASSADLRGLSAEDQVLVQHSLVGAAASVPTLSADNLDGVDPQLGELSSNGPRTETMPPAAGSPVVDAGDPDFTTSPSTTDTDQRGAARIVAGTVGGTPRTDMGAVEYVPAGDDSGHGTGSGDGNGSANGGDDETPTTPTTPVPPPSGTPQGGRVPTVPPAVPDAPLTLTTDKGKIAEVAPGEKVVVIGTGFAPSSYASVIIYSEPQVLATVLTDGTGSFRAEVVVPAGLPAGQHSLVASGTAPDGTERFLRLNVTVDAAGNATIDGNGDGVDDTLAYTGAEPLVPALLGAGALLGGGALLFVARRRRTAQD